MRAATKEKIAQEVLDWRHQGLIAPELAGVLATRFEGGPTLISTGLRWLAFFALLQFGLAVLGLIGVLVGDAAVFFGALVVGALSAAAWYFGVRMVSDHERRYPLSGAVLLTAGLVGIFGFLTLSFMALGGRAFEAVYPAFMLIAAAAAIVTAYRYALRWPLALGILLLFHALGNWHAYAGHGAYFLGIRDERVTAVAGLIALAFGLWHEEQWERDAEHRAVGFGHLFIIFGLLYANLSVWFLSLSPGGVFWVVTFTVTGLAQIVAGARLQDARFVGFGVVFLSIDLYTRFFEHFWDSLSKGAFFFLAGLLAVVAGGLMELKSRQNGPTTGLS